MLKSKGISILWHPIELWIRIQIANLQSENQALKETLSKLNDQQAKNISSKDENFEVMRHSYEQAIENERRRIV